MSKEDFAAMREAMVVSQLRTSDVSDPRVIAAMRAVPREDYVPVARRDAAYIDRAVPLEGGRALNPPLATGRLLTEAQIEPGDNVLLIGAATGYAAALLAELGATVIAVESDAALASGAAVPANVTAITGPLNMGHAAGAPYDVLLIDGAVEDVPQGLVTQLKDGARVAVGIIERGVPRLCAGRTSGGALGLQSLADMEMVRLPGFERPEGFRF